MPNPTLFLGIDVGTGSARAGLFTAAGRMRGSAAHPIKLWKPAPDFAEQSSDDIWAACGRAVRGALQQAGAAPAQVAGIGFDATCSLVCLDAADHPVTVSPTGRDAQNVIVWMDHRAIPQVARPFNRFQPSHPNHAPPSRPTSVCNSIVTIGLEHGSRRGGVWFVP